MHDPNSANEIKRRKCQNMLKMCTNGTMVFALWSVMRSIMEIMTGDADMMEALAELKVAEELSIGLTFFVTATLILVTICRFYVWRSALREAEGLKTNNLYIAATLFLIFIDSSIFPDDFSYGLKATNILRGLLDLTSIIILIVLLFQIFALRRLNRIIAEEG